MPFARRLALLLLLAALAGCGAVEPYGGPQTFGNMRGSAA
jgi:predicted small lipoprotein YifL